MPKQAITTPKQQAKSSTLDSWCTPLTIVEPVRAFGGGRIALDPCSNSRSVVEAEIEWYGPPKTNGLIMPWAQRGLNYFNPPFSDKFEWMRKAHQEAARGCEIIGLLPADTDTQWFHRFGTAASVRCFLNKRLKFIGDRDLGARFPCVLFYWGSRSDQFRLAFSSLGWLS